MIFPLPCLSICRPTARAMSQDCVTLASITSRNRAGVMSTIFATSFLPDATTRISTPPKRAVALLVISSHARSESGRTLSPSTSAPRSRHWAATTSSSALLPAAMTRRAPTAPEAPVTMATLPLISNSDVGLRRSSFIGRSGRIWHHHQHSADLISAVDDFTHLSGRNGAGIEPTEHRLLAVDNHRHLPAENHVDLLDRRRVRTSATSRQKVRQTHPLMGGASGFEALQPQGTDIAMVRRAIRLGVGEALHEHHSASPFSMR